MTDSDSRPPGAQFESKPLDIVDCQNHIDLSDPGRALAMMDALGIRAVVVDEYSGLDATGVPQPSYPLPNGVYRPIAPTAEAAAIGAPDRISYIQRLHSRDPELEHSVRHLKNLPHCRAARINESGDLSSFTDGRLERMFELLQQQDIPVFVAIFGRPDLIEPYVRKFDRLVFAIDHCGITRHGADLTMLRAVLDLARYANVRLKWSHAPSRLSRQAYPFLDLKPLLHEALERFGAERIMWASDFTEQTGHHSWADDLYSMKDWMDLSNSEKEWILGRSARETLNWPGAV